MISHAAPPINTDGEVKGVSFGSDDAAEKLRATNKGMGRRLAIGIGCTIAALFCASLMYAMMDMMEHVRPNPLQLLLWWTTRFYLWAALTPAVAYALAQIPLQPIAISRLFLHGVASLIFSLLHLVLHLSVSMLYMGLPRFSGGSSSLTVEVLHGFPLGVLAYWIILASLIATRYYENSRQAQVRTSKLQAQLAEARLRALQMQLQPHFVFNALHSLSDLVTDEPKTAVRLIARLGDFLRLTLQNSTSQWVPLKRELDFLEAYLEIERVRFGDRLKVIFNIDPQSLDAEVPSLILQPLVENAIRHGIASHIGPGIVEVESRCCGQTLLLEIRDNGPGMPANLQEGIGLRNTHQRLRETYGSSYALEMRNHGDAGVIASCELPYRRFSDEENSRR